MFNSQSNQLLIVNFFALVLALAVQSFADEFEVRVVDAQTKKPVSVRMMIRNGRGVVIKQRGIPFYEGYFCFFGKHVFKLPKGPYSYVIEKGPEYRTLSGRFEITKDATDGVTVEIPRFTNMSEKGWWSGDLNIKRPIRDIPVVMDANDLNFANQISFDNRGEYLDGGIPKVALKKVNERIVFQQVGGIDSRGGGALVFMGQTKPFLLPGEKSIIPLDISLSKKQSGLNYISNAAAWDLPILLARHFEAKKKNDPANRIDAIGIAGDAINYRGFEKRAVGLRPPDKSLDGVNIAGQWQTQIYYHLLNCGFRIPPGAGSGSGIVKNPVGYNRVYVHCGPNFSYESWLKNFKLGRVMVTNGPVMNVKFNGVLPGETFQVLKGESLEVETVLTLSLKEKANYLEIIRNGMVAKKVSLDEYAKAKGKLPKVTFTESGWMLVRVITNNKDTHRFVSSGPIYVEVGDKPLLKKASAQFFFDWILERAKAIQKSNAPEKAAIIEQIRPAYEFWKMLSE